MITNLSRFHSLFGSSDAGTYIRFLLFFIHVGVIITIYNRSKVCSKRENNLILTRTVQNLCCIKFIVHCQTVFYLSHIHTGYRPHRIILINSTTASFYRNRTSIHLAILDHSTVNTTDCSHGPFVFIISTRQQNILKTKISNRPLQCTTDGTGRYFTPLHIFDGMSFSIKDSYIIFNICT